jgi:hypothetical protein
MHNNRRIRGCSYLFHLPGNEQQPFPKTYFPVPHTLPARSNPAPEKIRRGGYTINEIVLPVPHVGGLFTDFEDFLSSSY